MPARAGVSVDTNCTSTVFSIASFPALSDTLIVYVPLSFAVNEYFPGSARGDIGIFCPLYITVIVSVSIPLPPVVLSTPGLGSATVNSIVFDLSQGLLSSGTTSISGNVVSILNLISSSPLGVPTSSLF